MIGRRLGDYRVLAKIGRGGMGSVYLASDRDGGRVAIKVLEARGDRPEQLGDGLRRFAQELDGLRRIDSPRIVKALGPVQYAADAHFFPMEYVRGRNLAQVLDEVGRLEPQEVLKIAGEVLEGLEAAHAAGVLHRDVKSANVLIAEDGHVKVCDFGLARAVDRTRLTLSGQLLGTPAYVSPEQARGHASRVEGDLYSLGVVLYEALTGTLPFQAETPLALLRLHLDQAPDPPSARRPGLPAQLDAFLLQALAKDPTQRFASATAMKAAVEDLRTEAQGETSTRLETAVRKLVQAETQALEEAVRRNTAPRASRLAAVLGVLIVGAFAVWFSGALSGGTDGVIPAAVPGPATPLAPAAVQSAAAPDSRESAPTAVLVLHTGEEVPVDVIAIGAGRIQVRTADGELEAYAREDVLKIRYGR